MAKVAGIQEFSTFKDLEHVFKSNKLKIVDSQGIEYNHGLNNQSEYRLVVTKYTKLSNLERSIRDRTFYFSSPLEWLDPFEMRFFRPRIQIGNNENVIVHACCFACNDIENEEGFWQIWSKNETEPIVRVTYNVVRLLTSLNNQAGNTYNYYLGGMEYKSRKEILNQEVEDRYEQIDDYLNKLCLKRIAYKYENELRLFIKKRVANNFEAEIKNTIIRDIDYNDGIIAEITLQPANPLGNSHPAREMMKQYQKGISIPAKVKLTNLIDEGLLTCKLTQSSLYCSEIKKRTYKL